MCNQRMWTIKLTVIFLFIWVPSATFTKTGIDQIVHRLDKTLSYIHRNYEKINVDCLFGVVLTEAILSNSDVSDLKQKCRDIYRKTVPLMQQQAYWNQFAHHLVKPQLWLKPLKYKSSEFRKAYAMKSRVRALFSPQTYQNFTEGMSDECLASVINSTLKLAPEAPCRLSKKCESFIGSFDGGSGYILTHKLLLLQVAKVRKCKIHPKTLSAAIKKICAGIYTELLSVEYFASIEEIFDLFLEQTLLCGYEGFADFLQAAYLERIFKIQHSSGCFPMSGGRRKRETNEWRDGCADHTTGLGAAVLALYFNYLHQHEEIVKEWF